jgi:methylmalonyl-CoA/ethylmalonyl-CoA epimerase
VDDLDRTTEALGTRGVHVLGGGEPQTSVAGDRIAFVHPADFLGALVELEEHAGSSGDRQP